MAGTIAAEQIEDKDDQLVAAKWRLDAIVVERCNRIRDNPDLYFAPDQRDRDLVGQIYALRRVFISLRAQYHSARGEYYFVGCLFGEHKKCKRQITRDGARLVCGCPCHKVKEGA